MSSECLGLILLSPPNLPGSIKNQIQTFLNIYLASSTNSILSFYNSTLLQFNFENDLSKLVETSEKITTDPSLIHPSFMTKFIQLICKMNKLNGNLKKRILIIYNGEITSQVEPVEKEIRALKHKIISIGYFCKESKIICDFVSIHSLNSLNQLAIITGGFYITLSDTNYLLNVLTCFVGLNVSIRNEIIPVRSEPISSSTIINSYCNCHLKSISIGYLCPICMALYCSFVPVCKYCKSKFEFIK